MLPKFNKHHLVWIAGIVIVILYIFAPTSGVTLIIHQIFHTLLSFLISV